MYLAVAITVGTVVTGWRRFLIATPAAAVLTHLAITVLALVYRRSLGFDDTYDELMLGQPQAGCSRSWAWPAWRPRPPG